MTMSSHPYATRRNKGAVLYNPLKETDPIYIDCSELYAMMNKDCLSYILDILYREDAVIQEKKMDHIRKLSEPRKKTANDFFDNMADKLDRNARCYKFMGYSERNTSIFNYLKEKIGYLHKVYFRNTGSRVQGCMDGIVCKDLMEQYDRKNDISRCEYVILYFCDKMNAYHRQKAIMVLLYGASMYSEFIDPNLLLFVNKDGNTSVLMVSEEERVKTRKMVREVRYIKRMAPWFSSDDLLNILRNANERYLPNMESKILRNDKIWKPIKKQLSYELGEITGLWMCSDVHRQRAFSQGVRSWRDLRFTPALVGINDPWKASVLEKIVDMNRQDPCAEDFEWMRVDAEMINKWPILLACNKKQAFFDFEYLEDGTIYMIGVYLESHYHCLWASALSPEGEKNLLQQFNAYCILLSRKHPGMQFWYWHAEKSVWRKQCLRHGLEKEASETNIWHDACDLMRSGTAVVHGALDFSLKSVIPAFYRHDKVPFRYDDLDCEDGKASLDVARSYYRDGRANDVLRETLEAYNRIDCEAVHHIMKEIIGILQIHREEETPHVATFQEEGMAEAAAVAGILGLEAVGS